MHYKKYGSKRIVVGVDINDGYVSTSGWLKTSTVHYLDFLKELEKLGVEYIVCTDISKDGTLTGPSFELYENIHSKEFYTICCFWWSKRCSRCLPS